MTQVSDNAARERRVVPLSPPVAFSPETHGKPEGVRGQLSWVSPGLVPGFRGGLLWGYDEVVFRGDVNTGEYIAFWRRDRRVVVGMNVNVWDVTETIAELVPSDGRVDCARLVDSETPLTEVLADTLEGAQS